MLNLDYIVNTKNTLSFKFYRSWEPQNISFSGAAYLPGTPAVDPFGYHNMVTRLTTIVNNSLVNELHVSYQRTTTDLFQHPPASSFEHAINPAVPGGAKLPGWRIAVQPGCQYSRIFPGRRQFVRRRERAQFAGASGRPGFLDARETQHSYGWRVQSR